MSDTNLGPVLSAVNDYGDARYDAGRVKGRADRQADVDDLVAQLAAVRTERDTAVQVLSEHMATHAPPTPVEPKGDVSYRDLTGSTPTDRFAKAQGKVVTLPPGLIEGTDFRTPANYPVYSIFGYQLKGLIGSGREHSVLGVKTRSSTRAAEVPKPEVGKENTNQFNVLRIDGKHNPEVAHLAVHGTHQGHMYNGVVLYAGSTYMHDVLIKGIPGDSAVNPGETTPLGLFRQTGSRIVDVEIDGRDDAGALVTASGIGTNFGGSHVFERVAVHHTAYGSGFVNYEAADLTFRDCSSTDTAFYGLNFENISGTVLVERHTFARNARTRPWSGERGVHVGIATNRGSATYTFVDPVFDGPKFVVRSTGYKGKAKTQDDTKIRLVIDGKDRPDLLELRAA